MGGPPILRVYQEVETKICLSETQAGEGLGTILAVDSKHSLHPSLEKPQLFVQNSAFLKTITLRPTR